MAQEKVSVAQNLLRPLMLSGNQDQTPFCIDDWNLCLSIFKSVRLEIHTMLKHAFPGNSHVYESLWKFLIIPISQVNKLRSRLVDSYAQGHRAKKDQS